MKGSQMPEWVSALRTWMTRQPKLSLAAGAAALALLSWAIYAPSFAAIRRDSRRWSSLKTEMGQIQNLLEMARRGEIRPLPSQEELPELLKQLNVEAKRFRVSILSVSPGRADGAGPGQPILLSVELQLDGEFRGIGQFLGALRNEPSLGMVTVRHFQIVRDERLLPRLRVQLAIELALKQENADGA